MNHAVISCLHANLAAVEAVLDDIDSQGIQTITCLGDLVGYGPQPNEVVELVRQREIPTCQGCWDEDIICLLYTSPSPRDYAASRMPSSA